MRKISNIKDKLIKILIVIQVCIFAFFSEFISESPYGGILIYSLMNFIIFLIIAESKVRTKFLIFILYFVYMQFYYYLLGKQANNVVPNLFFLLSTFLLFYQLFRYGYGKFTIKSITAATALLSIYGIIEYSLKFNPIFINLFRETYVQESIKEFFTADYAIRISFGHCLITATCLSIISILLVNIKNNYCKYILIIISFLACFFTGKRTGSFLLILSLLCYYFLKWLIIRRNDTKISKNKINRFLICMLIVIVILLIPFNGKSIFMENVDRILLLRSEHCMSIIHRLTSIKKSLCLFMSQNIMCILFGQGLNSLINYYITNNIAITVPGFYAIDNTYVSFLYDFGLINFLLVIYFNFKVIKKALRNIIKNENFLELSIVVSYCMLLMVIFIFDALCWFSVDFLLALLLAYTYFISEKND